MIENHSNDYYIAKSVWYDDGERDYDYHMFRKGDDGYIYKLIHRSYFLPAGFYGPYSEGGFWFENQATEEVFLYTSNQNLKMSEARRYCDPQSYNYSFPELFL